ncbi:MAG: prolipoprotein diacylglyceryl transferase, partial [Anaerolineae bacterium]
MFPVISIGSAVLPTYPFLVIIAFWLGLWLSAREARQIEFDDDHVYNAGLFGLLGGLLSARLWYVVENWRIYADDITEAFALNASALAVVEGAATGIIIALIYLMRHRLSIATFADLIAPGLALATAVAGLGAFLGGVGPGLPSGVPWAVPVLNAARHPVQLYNALGSLLILGLLLRRRDRWPWPTFAFWLFITLYSGLRLFTERFRVATPDMLTASGFRLAQLGTLLTLVVALAIIARGGIGVKVEG